MGSTPFSDAGTWPARARHFVLVVSFIAAGALAHAHPGLAQDSTAGQASRAVADQMVEEGLALRSAGRDEDALAKFEAAYRTPRLHS